MNGYGIRNMKKLMVENLLANVEHYQFQQVLYLLETNFLNDGIVREDHPQLKFSAANSVCFPGSDIKSAHLNKQQQVELLFNFMGLYGVDSPLPQYFTDLILRDNDGAESLRQFLAVLNHRLWCLLYRGWKKYHPVVEVHKEQSRFLYYLHAFSGGVLNPSDRQEYALAGLLGSKFNSAVGLISCIQHLLNRQQVMIHQFQPHWRSRFTLEPLGTRQLCLGDNIVLGNQVVSLQRRITVEIGPISALDAMQLWPNQLLAKQLNNLIKRYLPPMIQHDLLLKIQPDLRRTLQLGALDNFLGWSTWIGAPLKQNYLLQIAYKEK